MNEVIENKCPYTNCGQEFTLPIAEGILPQLQKHKCERCFRVIHTLHSRINPLSYTEASFHKIYKFNRGTRHVTFIGDHA